MTSHSTPSAVAFYDQLIKDEGIENAHGWSVNGQTARFRVLLDCIEQAKLRETKVLDYGCGAGDFFQYLHSGDTPRYLGVDVNKRFTSHARARWGSYHCTKFVTGTVLEGKVQRAIQRFKPTITVASGVFCLRKDASLFKDTIRCLYVLSDIFVFNVLTHVGNPKRVPRDLVAWKIEDIMTVLRYSGCSSWQLIRDYLNNDVTVVMKKGWSFAK